MPAGEALEDDYIVSLLKKDADEHTKRYSMVGSGRLLSAARRRPDTPKPNTRFLKNIIRETDSHNAALKAKEEEESRARLRGLRREERGGKRKREGDGGGADEERDGGGKRRRERESRPGRWASALGLDGAGERRAEKGCRKDEKRQRQPRDESKDREGERSTHRHRHRSELSAADRKHRKSWRSERSHSRERSRSPRHREEHRRRPHSRSKSPATNYDKPNTSDPDGPPSAVLGPEPPSQPLPRGRGALKPSNMDSRFDSSYNPTQDVALNISEEEGDDWDMALEALKARTKWRAQGAERLRAAGFAEEEIERWEKGGSGADGAEKDVEDVRWRGRGEGREWDRGKVVDGDGEGEGEVVLKAEWAR